MSTIQLELNFKNSELRTKFSFFVASAKQSDTLSIVCPLHFAIAGNYVILN